MSGHSIQGSGLERNKALRSEDLKWFSMGFWVTPRETAEILKLEENGTINRNGAKIVHRELWEHNRKHYENFIFAE